MTVIKADLEQRIKEELKQGNAITDTLINKILYSKRLLVDHVDALEHCMAHMKPPNDSDQVRSGLLRFAGTRELFTAKNTCILVVGTLLEHLITPKSFRLTMIPSVLVTSGFGIMYVVKHVFVFRNKIVERELESLIRAIDDFGNCIRRNMTYFNEILVMKQQELIESRQIERAWDCITAAKEVTEILYDATRKLEEQYPIPTRFSQYYAPMEELRECEYFKKNVTDYNPKHIKDFHNIFAYVQSQYLLRLALTIATKPSISTLNSHLVKIDCQIRQLVLEEETHFKNLAIELNKRRVIDLGTIATAKTMQNRRGPVAVLQDSSLKLSGRMVAVAAECQALDITLQRLTETEAEHKDNTKQLIDVANNMRAIENALSICFDDFHRLMLVYNKFLNSKILAEHSKHEKSDKKNTTPSDSECPESYLRVEISEHDSENNKDDFYAYMYDETQANAEQEALQGEPKNKNLEILNFEKRISKGKFRPVLQQLKDRIDPIRKDMLEKEREVLRAKGINVDELLQATSEDDEGSATVPFNSKGNKTKLKSDDNKDDDDEENESDNEDVEDGTDEDDGDDDDDDDEDEDDDDEDDDDDDEDEDDENDDNENDDDENDDNGTDDDDEDGEDDDDTESSEGSVDLQLQTGTKTVKVGDCYAEVRHYLVQKRPINLFKTDDIAIIKPPSAVTGEEEIIESEFKTDDTAITKPPSAVVGEEEIIASEFKTDDTAITKPPPAVTGEEEIIESEFKTDDTAITKPPLAVTGEKEIIESELKTDDTAITKPPLAVTGEEEIIESEFKTDNTAITKPPLAVTGEEEIIESEFKTDDIAITKPPLAVTGEEEIIESEFKTDNTAITKPKTGEEAVVETEC